jgi:hypothetical protein
MPPWEGNGVDVVGISADACQLTLCYVARKRMQILAINGAKVVALERLGARCTGIKAVSGRSGKHRQDGIETV